MKLSNDVDPEGVRTIAVVTKVDKADKGIRAKIEGKDVDSVRLALGYVGVRNRTQDEIDEGIYTFCVMCSAYHQLLEFLGLLMLKVETDMYRYIMIFDFASCANAV